MEYTPKPIDTSAVELPTELEPLVEQMAKNVHEVWAQKRMEEGWRYGDKRDDELRLHPCLVAYEQLPEIEKEYDRSTALGPLKLIRKLGLSIEKR